MQKQAMQGASRYSTWYPGVGRSPAGAHTPLFRKLQGCLPLTQWLFCNFASDSGDAARGEGQDEKPPFSEPHTPETNKAAEHVGTEVAAHEEEEHGNDAASDPCRQAAQQIKPKASDPCDGQASNSTVSDPCDGQASNSTASDPLRSAGQAKPDKASDPCNGQAPNQAIKQNFDLCDGQAIQELTAASDPWAKCGQATTTMTAAPSEPHDSIAQGDNLSFAETATLLSQLKTSTVSHNLSFLDFQEAYIFVPLLGNDEAVDTNAVDRALKVFDPGGDGAPMFPLSSLPPRLRGSKRCQAREMQMKIHEDAAETKTKIRMTKIRLSYITKDVLDPR